MKSMGLATEITGQEDKDFEFHDRAVSIINSLLKEKTHKSYEELGKYISGTEYIKEAGCFNDLKEFLTSYMIYSMEDKMGASKTIYDITESIEDYVDIRRSFLYCFRRIQLRVLKEDIDKAFNEILNRGISPLYIIGMLKELEVGDRGYVGRYMADLLSISGKEMDGTLLKSLVSNFYDDEKSSVSIEREYSGLKKYDKKICFITCVNNDRSYEECTFYINNLIVPDGAIVDSVAIKEADSMTAGYNAGMYASDADIKIYLHQDVCIINPFFLIDIMDIFDSDRDIGMIGMIGAPKLPDDAVMWHGNRVGKLYHDDRIISYKSDSGSRYSGCEIVEAVDGLLIATNKNIKWRDDIFDGWDFYDVSQAAEYRKSGYKVVVPVQESPWVIHDDGVLNLSSYEKYRERFIKQYRR